MTHLQFGVNLPRKAMQFYVGGGPYRPWVPSVTDLLGMRLASKNGGGTNIQTRANLDAGSCWRRCPVRRGHRGGGLCCFGVFLKEKHGRSRWPRGTPLWAGHAEGRKQLSLGQEILAGVCAPRSHGPSSSRKGGLGDESLVKIWSDRFQFHLTVGTNSSFIY